MSKKIKTLKEQPSKVRVPEVQPAHTLKARLKAVPHGVAIILPASRSFYHHPFGQRIMLQRWKDLAKVSLGLLGVFGVMGFFMIRAMWQPVVNYLQWAFGNGSLAHAVVTVAALGIPVAGWVVIMYVASATLLSSILNKEFTIFHGERMTIKTTFLGITRQEADYEFSGMQHFRFLPEPPKGQGHLQFEYEGQVVECCRALDAAEAQVIYTQITDIMTSHCHVVEQIVFGTSQMSDNALSEKRASHYTLQNPDVSSLTTSFFHLKHLHIQTESYDLYQLEQFLTYAVNYIGEEYLKEYVEVHLYGNLERLDTNLRNSLTNLCKQVYEYPSKFPL